MDAAALESTAVKLLPPIRFIPSQQFKEVGSFPRFPDNSNICVNLDDIDVENSLLIFISHCWLRGWSGAEGFDKKPHPDNTTGGKYDLCISGINELMKWQAPGFDRCYLWLDYGCIDEDGDPAGELKQLDKIVGVCDCLFTPAYDANHLLWRRPTPCPNPFEYDQSAGWKGDEHSYLNRGWCRVEMFYGSSIPLNDDTENRKRKMRSGLLHNRSRGLRPHFFYGSKCKANGSAPVILPSFHYNHYEKYPPAEGNLSVASDKVKIEQLVVDLVPFLRKVNVGIVFDDVGECTAGTRRGTSTDLDGNVYVGDFVNNVPHGFGIYEYASSSVYEGHFIGGKKNGHGKYAFASGDVYEGYYIRGQENGHGKFTFPDGSVYEGEYFDGKATGHGKWISANGDIREGHYKGQQ
jgi:hypothetical protein